MRYIILIIFSISFVSILPQQKYELEGEKRLKNIRMLTEVGENAEAYFSFDGSKINYLATVGDLKCDQIFIMNLDGSEQTRLTFEKGYDGGAFFSADGNKIVFRASRPQTEKELEDYNELVTDGLVRPTNLEIFVMNSDGKNLKQVTNLKAASFAPFFHPDGKRIIFSSNYGSVDRREFNLFIINEDGTGLEQVTFNPTFDGFPMFSPDGKYLIFGSNRFNKNPNDTNVFIAEWVD